MNFLIKVIILVVSIYFSFKAGISLGVSAGHETFPAVGALPPHCNHIIYLSRQEQVYLDEMRIWEYSIISKDS